jgi:protein O-GlcNAc transferase
MSNTAEAIQLHRSGRLTEAEALYIKLLQAAPTDLQLQYMLAALYHQTGRNKESHELLTRLVAAAPQAYPSLGLFSHVLAALGHTSDAVAMAERYLKVQPNDASMAVFAANLLFSMHQYDKAILYFRQALEISPDSAPILNDIGNCYFRLRNGEEALKHYRKALALQPKNAQLQYNLACFLKVAGDPDAHRVALATTLALDPGHLQARCDALTAAMRVCDWKDLEEDTRLLTAALETLISRHVAASVSPAPLNYLRVPPELITKVTQHYARNINEQVRSLGSRLTRRSRQTKQRIHVGYLSTDFFNHAVGTLTYKLFGCHDRSRFKIHAYSLRHQEDNYQRDIAADCDIYRNISSLGLAEAAQRIIDDEIDILVDMAGYTGAARPEILALRPAPIQISYLGYINTMGADFIDYIIADEVVLPPTHENRYTEKVIRLPNFLVVSELPVAGTPPSRAELGLPDDQFIFCSFNHSYKLTPVVFRAWMEILHSTPNSILWLYVSGMKTAEKNLLSAAESLNVSPSRIIFAETVPLNEHLLRLHAADLCLDTYGFSGGATTACSLMVGLPVLSWCGDSYLGRMGSSINQHIGLPEMDCLSETQYVNRAVELATCPDKLLIVRERIREGRLHKRLFQTREFVRVLEDAYKQIWAAHSDGVTPQSINIE